MFDTNTKFYCDNSKTPFDYTHLLFLQFPIVLISHIFYLQKFLRFTPASVEITYQTFSIKLLSVKNAVILVHFIAQIIASAEIIVISSVQR